MKKLTSLPVSSKLVVMENIDHSKRKAKTEAMEKLINALKKYPLTQKDFLDYQKKKYMKKDKPLNLLFRWICKSLHIHINQ